MNISVLCTLEQQQEILKKPTKEDVAFTFYIDDVDSFVASEATAYFNLIDSKPIRIPHQKEALVFVNAVNQKLSELPTCCIRINGWNGFISREEIEIVANYEQSSAAEQLLNNLGWKFQFVPDQRGMIAPRIISMIINEAYFGLADCISTKEEIDIAMKLGTNYPYGPFEWAEKIGKHHIFELLNLLAKEDERYQPCQLLKEEITQF